MSTLAAKLAPWFALQALAFGALACASQPPVSPPEPMTEAVRPVQGGRSGATDHAKTIDLNNDGRAEITKYYRSVEDAASPGGQRLVLVREDIDVNWDGRVDIWRYFGEQGLVEKEEWDTDFDGIVDEVRTFENGVIVRSERDRNNDGRPDVFRYYVNGELERKETDTNGDGKIDRWEYYVGQTLDRIGVDKDHDGVVDVWAKAGTETAQAP